MDIADGIEEVALLKGKLVRATCPANDFLKRPRTKARAREGDIWLVRILVEWVLRRPHWREGEKDILMDVEREKSRPAVVGERNGTGRDGMGKERGWACQEYSTTIAIA